MASLQPYATTRRLCSTPRCSNLQPCSQHHRKPFAGARRTNAAFFTTGRWKRGRVAHLAAEPMCRQCGSVASVVDHIIPPKGNEAAFFDEANWQSMCAGCHNAKTGREARAR